VIYRKGVRKYPGSRECEGVHQERAEEAGGTRWDIIRRRIRETI
jgi:hypothetical protein